MSDIQWDDEEEAPEGIQWDDDEEPAPRPAKAPSSGKPRVSAGGALLRAVGNAYGTGDLIGAGAQALGHGISNLGELARGNTSLGDFNKDNLNTFKSALRGNRALTEEDKEHHGGVSFVGNMAGGMATAPLMGAGLGLRSALVLNSGLGAIGSAASGGDVALGAATGAAGTLAGAGIGKGVSWAAGKAAPIIKSLAERVGISEEAAAKWLAGFAEERAVKATGEDLAGFRGIDRKGNLNELGRDLLDSGVVTKGSSLEDVAERSRALADATGKRVRQFASELDETALESAPTVSASIVPQGRTPAVYDDVPASRGKQGYSEMNPPGAPILARRSYSEMNPPSAPLRAKRSYSEMNSPQAAPEPPPRVARTEARPALRTEEAAPLKGSLEVATRPVGKGSPFVKPAELADRLEKELLGSVKGMPGYAGYASTLEGHIDELRALGRRDLELDSSQLALSGLTGKRPRRDTLTFSEAEDIKQGLDNLLNWNTEQNEGKELTKRLRSILNSEIEERAESAASKLLPADSFKGFKDAKRLYGSLATAREAAEDRLSRNKANRLISPSDHAVGATAALTTGGMAAIPMAVTGAIGNRLVRGYGPSFAAATSDSLSKSLARQPISNALRRASAPAPETLSRLASMAATAEQRGDSGLFTDEGELSLKDLRARILRRR